MGYRIRLEAFCSFVALTTDIAGFRLALIKMRRVHDHWPSEALWMQLFPPQRGKVATSSKQAESLNLLDDDWPFHSSRVPRAC